MKKFLAVSALACLGVSAFAADGATLFKKCAICHGAKAEKVYLNKVPALNTLSAEEITQALKEYKAGTRNKFGQGGIMKIQLTSLSEADLEAIAQYIQTLK
ncbi:c-type cytochrome [Campylobacter hepaticus]|uniref:Cytochrome c n=1 Tax=Campylobacter hepaticus TaxID=1813019 RepID=A0A424YZF5_9BACT|nr:c-type cytochrome [Campylobacter hepaticus]AXP08362.1 cytochrome c [Campylobacter hepaticus]MCZ0772187.1 c-type cytochrome [Campylobacter hepaticus]MCZ0773656.1 c-type cytochrome [Campylobacter hepaticus]MCZ0774906.1 c-type cytochrome [Campylobacter hepaticus]MDX2330664.1 c-type cytochrome [Campylobacter hepaticus]